MFAPMLFLKNERAKRQQRFPLCLFLALTVQPHRASICSWLAHPCNCPNPWSSWRMPGVISRRIWGFVWAFCMIPFVFNCILFFLWSEWREGRGHYIFKSRRVHYLRERGKPDRRKGRGRLTEGREGMRRKLMSHVYGPANESHCFASRCRKLTKNNNKKGENLCDYINNSK